MHFSNAALLLSLIVAAASTQASPLPHTRVLRKKSSCAVRPSSSAGLSASGSASKSASASASVSSTLVPLNNKVAATTTVTSSVTSTAVKSSSTSISTSTSTSTSSSKASTTSTSSSTAAAATTAASSSGSYKSGWTSNSGMYPALSSVSLSTVLAATKGKAGSITSAPDGQQGMQATYLAGTYGTGNAGMWSYYANYNNAALFAATEVELTYSVYFQSGFQFNKGGKLPGLYGGQAGVFECSGGNQDTRDACFSMRLMFRTNGMGELYTYFPETDGNVASCEATNGVCDQQVYGLSFGRGKWTWATGQWVTVKERVRLNDVGSSNGYSIITYNGNVALTANNLEIRTTANSGFQGIMMSTFFGGSDSTWSSPQTQSTWFKDFSVGIIA